MAFVQNEHQCCTKGLITECQYQLTFVFYLTKQTIISQFLFHLICSICFKMTLPKQIIKYRSYLKVHNSILFATVIMFIFYFKFIICKTLITNLVSLHTSHNMKSLVYCQRTSYTDVYLKTSLDIQIRHFCVYNEYLDGQPQYIIILYGQFATHDKKITI